MTNMECKTETKSRQSERGVALIVALLAMTVMAGLGLALLVSSSTESLINASFRRSGLSFFDARGGVEEARGRLGPDALPLTNTNTGSGASVAIPCSAPATCPPMYDVATGAVNTNVAYYVRLDTTIDPGSATCTYLGQSGICRDPDAPAVAANRIYFLTTQPGTAMPYVWTKITLATQKKLKRNLLTPCNPSDPSDPSYCDPTALDDTKMLCWKNQNRLSIYNGPATAYVDCGNPVNPVYILTSLAIEPSTPTPTTRIVREVVAPGKIPGLPGPLVLDGFPGVYIPPTSNPFTLSGCDAAFSSPCNTSPPHTPSVVVPTVADVTTAQTAIPDTMGTNRNPNYPGVTNNGCNPNPVCGTGSPNSASVAAATDTTVFPNGNPLTSNPYFADCAGVANLYAYISAAADYTYNGNQSSLSTPGSLNDGNSVINVINGDATLAVTDMRPSPSDRGFGILLVTGNLTISGSTDYNGLVIVLGGTMYVTGGGGGTFIGGIFVVNQTTCPGSLGPVLFDPSGGGSFTIQYDSRYANPANGWLPMQILSMN